MNKKRLLFLTPLAILLTGCDTSKIEESLSSDVFLSKLIPNWISFVTQLGALIVLIIVVFILAYKPVKKIIKTRQDYIENNIKDSEESKAKWKENELKSQETVLASNRTAQEILNDAKIEAQKEKEKILEEASLEVEKMKNTARDDIEKMELEAQEEIRKEIVSVALDASKEVLSREVNSKDNARLVEQFIEEVKK